MRYDPSAYRIVSLLVVAAGGLVFALGGKPAGELAGDGGEV